MGWVEDEAVGMRCWTSRMGGWVGGWGLIEDNEEEVKAGEEGVGKTNVFL